MTTQLQCPYCHAKVWVGATGQCPSCRKQVPPQLLQQAVLASNEAEGLAAAESSGLDASITRPSAPQHKNLGNENRTPLVIPGATTQVESRQQKYALQFNRGSLAIGMVLLLMSAFFLFNSMSDSSTSDSNPIRHQRGRRAAALKSMLGGEANFKSAAGLLFLVVGTYSLATSRKLVVVATTSAIDDACCKLCRQPAPHAAEAFLVVKGGVRTFPGAFKCIVCDNCIHESNRIRSIYWLQVPAMIFGVIVIPFAVLGAVMFVASFFGLGVELKPGADRLLAGLLIVAVLLAALILYCHRQVTRRTGKLLDTQVDDFVRQKADIRRWGWPRRLIVLRTIAVNVPIVDIEHENEPTGECPSCRTQVQLTILQRAIQDALQTLGDIHKSPDDLRITVDEAPEKQPLASVNQVSSEFLQIGDVKRDLYVGAEEKVIFSDYPDYVAGNHWLFTQPYKLLRIIGLPDLEVAFPAKPPSYSRISEVELIQSIKSVPDARMIKGVTVVDFPHRDEHWIRQQRNEPNARIFCEVDENNRITLYLPNSLAVTINAINHQWWSIARLTNPESARIFDLVGDMETPINADRGKIVTGNEAEKWKILGQCLTGAVPEVSALSAMTNPMRTSVLCEVLNNILSEVPENLQSPKHEFLCQLVVWIQVAVKPMAINRIESSLEPRTPAQEQVLRYLNGCGHNQLQDSNRNIAGNEIDAENAQ